MNFYSNTIPSRVLEIIYIFMLIIPLAAISNKLNIEIEGKYIDKFSKYTIYNLLQLLDNLFFFTPFNIPSKTPGSKLL